MPTLTDTKINHALLVPAAAGEPPIPENLATRPRADGVVTDNKDPDSMVSTSAQGIDRTDSDSRLESMDNTSADGVDRKGNNALGTHSGGEVIGDFSSYVTNGTTDTVSRSGNGVGLTDITDGTSNTLAFAGTEAADDSATRRAGISDGTSNTLMIGERSAASDVIESVATKYTMFDGEADGLSLGGDGADRLVRVDDLDMHEFQIGGGVHDVGDVLMGSIDSGNDSPQAHRAGGSAALHADADGQAYGIANAAKGPAADEHPNGNVNNIDLWVGGVVLDVGDVLVDDGSDGGNLVQARTAGGSTAPHTDPAGQANGIIAILIGLHTDMPCPLDNASLALD